MFRGKLPQSLREIPQYLDGFFLIKPSYQTASDLLFCGEISHLKEFTVFEPFAGQAKRARSGMEDPENTMTTKRERRYL